MGVGTVAVGPLNTWAAQDTHFQLALVDGKLVEEVLSAVSCCTAVVVGRRSQSPVELAVLAGRSWMAFGLAPELVFPLLLAGTVYQGSTVVLAPH